MNKAYQDLRASELESPMLDKIDKLTQVDAQAVYRPALRRFLDSMVQLYAQTGVKVLCIQRLQALREAGSYIVGLSLDINEHILKYNQTIKMKGECLSADLGGSEIPSMPADFTPTEDADADDSAGNV